MSVFELNALLSRQHLRYKEQWEIMRMSAFVGVQTMAKNKLKPTDILNFSWDEPTTPKHPELTKEERIQKAKAFEQQLNNNLNKIQNGGSSNKINPQ